MCSYKSLLLQSYSRFSQMERRTRQECAATQVERRTYCLSPAVQLVLTDTEKNQIGMCSYKSLLPQSCSRYSQMQKRTRQECAATNPDCLSPAVGTHRHREELDRNVQLQVLIASVLQSVLTDREKNQIGMCSYKSLLSQPCSRYSKTEIRTRQGYAATSTQSCSNYSEREELDRNVQLQVLIASVLQSVLRDREKNQIGMCSYKSLLPQSCSQYSETGSRTRQECAATSPYCLSPAVSTHRQREELDRNVQLQVLIVSALQLVLTDREKNQIGMCSYKYLLPQSCSRNGQLLRAVLKDRVELDRNVQLQVLIASVLQPVLKRQREELDRNVQLQVLIASVLQLVLTDREKNQIGMCSYQYLLPQSCSNYSERERRTRQECAATSPYCLSPDIGTHRHREELDRNVQLQVLIDSALHSVLRDRDQNQIGMCSYKSLLPQSYSQYSETGSRTRQECAVTSPYCLSPAVSTHRRREELDRNVQLQVLIASVLTVGTHRDREELDRNVQLQVLIDSASVLKDRDQNQIGMCSYKSLLPQPCSQY